MARKNNKQRYVNTRFWNDVYISALDPIEKLLFIYLLTNEHTNISGIYELPLKIMAVETGIDSAMFSKILPRLKEKIQYLEGMVVVKNWIKHQDTGSPNVKIGILSCLKDLDQEFLKNIVKQGVYTLPTDYIDTLCIPYANSRNYSNSNSNSNSNSIVAKSDAPVSEIKKDSPFILADEIKKLEDSSRRDLNIIALYFEYRKPDFENRKQYELALKRHLRPAGQLVSFTDKQIIKAIDYAHKEYKDVYTLETLLKILTK